MSQTTNALSTPLALPARPMPLAACVGTGFIPVIYHPNRVAEYLRHERFRRKAKATGAEAVAYAAKVIWYRERRAADKRRKIEALSHPWWSSHRDEMLDAAE
jgi:hypothetical protein